MSDFPFGLEKRSGRTEQWSKMGENTIYFVKFSGFWGIWMDLEKIGFQFGLNVSAYKRWYD